ASVEIAVDVLFDESARVERHPDIDLAVVVRVLLLFGRLALRVELANDVLDAVEVRVDLAADNDLAARLGFAERLVDATNVRSDGARTGGFADLDVGLVLPLAHRAIVVRPVRLVLRAARRRRGFLRRRLAATARDSENRKSKKSLHFLAPGFGFGAPASFFVPPSG